MGPIKIRGGRGVGKHIWSPTSFSPPVLINALWALKHPFHLPVHLMSQECMKVTFYSVSGIWSKVEGHIGQVQIIFTNKGRWADNNIKLLPLLTENNFLVQHRGIEFMA